VPDWTAPYHLPKVTGADFARRKAAYIAEHGFSMTIPGLSDIIKIRTEDPMTFDEHKAWKRKDWEKFSPIRLAELKKQKERRKARYLAILASPTPAVVQNAGSIMTAIDDAQDATITLAVLGNLARKVAPKLLGKLLAGPVGILAATSDLLNMVQQTGMTCMAPLYGKKAGEGLAFASPKQMKAKLKKSFNMKPRLLNKSDWIQGLQTTDQIFGFGISLGPVVGLAQDIAFGSVRARPGKFMDIKLPVPDFKHWFKAAQKILRAGPLLWGMPHYTDEAEVLAWITAAHLAFQQLFDITQEWNPLLMFSSIEDLEIQAPSPWHTQTIEVINEGPVPLGSVVGWPQTGNEWSPILDVVDPTEEIAAQNLRNFLKRNKHSWTGYVGGLSAGETARYALACLEGEADVAHDYSMQLKATLTMLKHGIVLDPNQPLSKFDLFEHYLDECEKDSWNPTIEQIIQWCGYSFNNIRLLKTGPATP